MSFFQLLAVFSALISCLGIVYYFKYAALLRQGGAGLHPDLAKLGTKRSLVQFIIMLMLAVQVYFARFAREAWDMPTVIVITMLIIGVYVCLKGMRMATGVKRSGK